LNIFGCCLDLRKPKGEREREREREGGREREREDLVREFTRAASSIIPLLLL